MSIFKSNKNQNVSKNEKINGVEVNEEQKGIKETNENLEQSTIIQNVEPRLLLKSILTPVDVSILDSNNQFPIVRNPVLFNDIQYYVIVNNIYGDLLIKEEDIDSAVALALENNSLEKAYSLFFLNKNYSIPEKPEWVIAYEATL